MQEDIRTDVLEQVMVFASEAHKGQIRKYSGEPYVNHPVRVMETCRTVTSDTSILCAALLHDVLEDTRVGEQEILSFLEPLIGPGKAQRTLQLVIQLTDVYTKESYPRHNRKRRKEMEHKRLSTISADAQTIKYADVIDNAPDTATADPDFAPKLLKEYRDMLDMIEKGDPKLYEKALATVESELAAF